MPSFKRPIGASGVALVLALVASSCGSGGDDQSTQAAGPQPTEAAAEAEGPSPSESAAEPTTDDAAESADGSDAAPEADEPAEAAGPQIDDHIFPDLSTVDITTGATINLADQLAGGDTPVLLWFFAPH